MKDGFRYLLLSMNDGMYLYMNKDSQVRRVTANLPASLLKEACQVSGAGITETLVEGLILIRRRAAAGKAAKLRGRLNLTIDLETSRERLGRCYLQLGFLFFFFRSFSD